MVTKPCDIQLSRAAVITHIREALSLLEARGDYRAWEVVAGAHDAVAKIWNESDRGGEPRGRVQNQ